MMSLGTSQQSIQFLGGPLDGLVESYEPAMELTLVVRGAGLAAKPPWIVYLLRKILHHPKRNLVCVAIYQLQSLDGLLQYQFVRCELTNSIGQGTPTLCICEETMQLLRPAGR